MSVVLRTLRGLGALVLVLALVGGTPVLLARIGRLPAAAAFPEILLQPDQGQLLLGGLTVVGWLAWGVFTLSILLETAVLLSGRRLRVRLPGLAAPRGLAAGLLLTIAAMLPVSAHAQPAVALPQPVEGPARAGEPARAAPVKPAEAPAEKPAGRSYTVQRGDDLWSIAERFYGHGQAWPRIVAANPMITSPDRIDIGWELVLPGVGVPADAGRAGLAAGAAARPEPVTPPPAQPAPVEEPELVFAPAGAESAASRTEASGTADEPSAAGDASPAARIAYATAGVSSLTAAAVLSRLAARRARQLTERPLGRRIAHPPAPAQHVEAALGQAQDPQSLRTLDLALRALGRHYRTRGEPLPRLGAIIVSDERISLEIDRPPAHVPAGFTVHGCALSITIPDAAGLAAQTDGPAEDPAPYPAVVCLGELPTGELLLHDLETIGALGLVGPADAVGQALAAVTLESAWSWWGRGQSVTVVDGDAELVAGIGAPNVVVATSLDDVLTELEAESLARRGERAGQHPRDLRLWIEPEAWRPRVVLVGSALTDDQRHRVLALTRNADAVVVAADPGLASLRIAVPPGVSTLPSGREYRAQLLPPGPRAALLDLMAATASRDHTPAPWWTEEPGNAVVVPFDPEQRAEAGIATQIRQPASAASASSASSAPSAEAVESSPSPAPATGAAVLSLAARRAATSPEEPAMDAHEPVLHSHQPTVLLVGPVDLVGARGERPPRAVRQCIEYAAWLLEHPHSTAAMMANALFVAEGTRRSNMSRLRTWLGADEAGERYLPEAYSGRIQLHAEVSSDWNRMQLLTIGGVNRAADANLTAVLDLVRGAPLADAAPGQWHWAEELRTDIASLVRDVGVVLCDRALERGELDLARWAASRALTAAPEDERLLVCRVRTEHRAGHRAEVERLALRLVRSARRLNIDLADETVSLLQEVMEGGSRVRLG